MAATINLGRDSSGRARVLDATTLAKLRWAERRLGIELTVVQGSYMSGKGADASKGTHDGGGVIDIRSRDIPARVGVAKVVKYLRWAGLIAWYRTEAQGFDPHIHAIDYGNPNLSRGARNQVTAWEKGLNGLASGGRDDGPRVGIPKNVPPEPNAKVLHVAQINAAALSGGRVPMAQVRVLQILLDQVGIDVGPADGKYQARTRAGFTEWQRRLGYHGRSVNGLVGKWSLSKLLAAARNKTWAAA